ncbi:hypothetical protein AY601_1762 [Pedobacter cryoconitis]|uniref:Uncharacterized protein n=1 Tax=Pedobacter cryoconitis TaxID=188932 RepID=A0A127VBK8_9SPHI|nr:hypothetical protein [Pedobacter cryoconitis]AMP98675.1 hypothetical protein AY601_1762 [Pedobacter cryoconitis]
MKTSNFKPRNFFDFSPHPYDIGNPIGFWQKYEDNHFLNKLLVVNEDEFEAFYKYHLSHALENNVCNEETFFVKVWGIVENRINKLKGEDPFSYYHDRHIFRIEKLLQFQKYLNSIDQWNARPAHIVLAEKEEIIQRQKKEIEELQARWDKIKLYEVSQKIWIKEGYLTTVIDLFQKIEKLEVPSGGNLLKYDHQVAYPRMISKYFSHGGNDISVETLRNYYVSKKDDEPVKGTSIQLERKLFKIVPVKGTKK